MANARWWIPWRVLSWLDSLGIWCWADLVGWKVWGGDCSVRRAVSCATQSMKRDGCLTCYCGYWDRVADGTMNAVPALSELPANDSNNQEK